MNYREKTKELVMEEYHQNVDIIFDEMDKIKHNEERLKLSDNAFNSPKGIYEQILTFNGEEPIPAMIFYMKETEDKNLNVDKIVLSIKGR